LGGELWLRPQGWKRFDPRHKKDGKIWNKAFPAREFSGSSSVLLLPKWKLALGETLVTFPDLQTVWSILEFEILWDEFVN
jgi:hypothetical protein